MSFLNSILRALFDAALYPFRELHPVVGLAVVSLVIGVLMLLVFKWTSDQDKLAAVKRKIHAGLFEIRLFNDDLRAILRGQWEILRHNLTYLRLSAVPLLWLIVPFVLIVAQLLFHYGYRGLEPGQQTLVKIELKEGEDVAGRPAIELSAPEGIVIEAGPVWIPAHRELAWRISAQQPGDYELSVRAGGETLTKSVTASEAVVRRSPIRLEPGFWNQLLYPAEDPLPEASPIRSISVTYPAGNVGFDGWEWEWTWAVLFIVLSVVFAFALRKPLGVTI